MADESENAPSERDNSQFLSTTLTLPADQAYHMLRNKVLDDMKIELRAWGRRRVSLILLVVAIVGFVGSTLLVQSIVTNLTADRLKQVDQISIDTRVALEVTKKEVDGMKSRAENAIRETKEETDRKKKAMEQAIGEAEAYRDKVKILQAEADKITRSLQIFQGRIESESKNVKFSADNQIAALYAEIDLLKKALSEMTEDPRFMGGTTTRIVKDKLEKARNLRETTKIESDKFEDNSQYPVYVVYSTNKLKERRASEIKALREAGFKVDVSFNFHEGEEESLDEEADMMKNMGEIPVALFNRHYASGFVLSNEEASSKAKQVAGLLRKTPDGKSVEAVSTKNILKALFKEPDKKVIIVYIR